MSFCDRQWAAQERALETGKGVGLEGAAGAEGGLEGCKRDEVVCQGRCSFVIVEDEGGPPIAVKRRVCLQLLDERSCGVGGETER